MALGRMSGLVVVLFVVFLFAGRFAVPASTGYTVTQSLSPLRMGPNQVYADWRAGSIWPSTVGAETVIEVNTAIKTPSTEPPSDELYAVLMSIWDFSGSYDQIGIADDYGVWELVYSYSTGPCTSPASQTTWNAMKLSTNTKYYLTIFTNSEVNGGTGGVYFQAFVDSPDTGLVFSYFLNNGANYLDAGYEFKCPSNTSYVYYDYSDYEQVVYTATDGGAPSYNFKLTGNNYCICISSAKTVPDSWTTWYYSGPTGVNVPSDVSVYISGSRVIIDN
jgi:hypothetical protein